MAATVWMFGLKPAKSLEVSFTALNADCRMLAPAHVQMVSVSDFAAPVPELLLVLACPVLLQPASVSAAPIEPYFRTLRRLSCARPIPVSATMSSP